MFHTDSQMLISISSVHSCHLILRLLLANIFWILRQHCEIPNKLYCHGKYICHGVYMLKYACMLLYSVSCLESLSTVGGGGAFIWFKSSNNLLNNRLIFVVLSFRETYRRRSKLSRFINQKIEIIKQRLVASSGPVTPQ